MRICWRSGNYLCIKRQVNDLNILDVCWKRQYHCWFEFCVLSWLGFQFCITISAKPTNPLITCKLEIQQQSEQISDNIWTTRLTYRPTMHWNYHFCWCTSRLKAERSSPIRPVSTCHVSTVIHTSENNIYSCWNTKNTRLRASIDICAVHYVF